MGLLSRTQSLQSAKGLLLANSNGAFRFQLLRFLGGLGEVFWSKKTYTKTKKNLLKPINLIKPIYKKDFPFFGLHKVD